MPGFDNLITASSARMVAKFANVTVTAKKDGAADRTFFGIFDEHTEVVQPWEAERAIIKPSVAVTDADYAGIDSSYTLEVRRLQPPESTGKDYKLDGKPRPDGAGLTVVFLGVKK